MMECLLNIMIIWLQNYTENRTYFFFSPPCVPAIAVWRQLVRQILRRDTASYQHQIIFTLIFFENTPLIGQFPLKDWEIMD